MSIHVLSPEVASQIAAGEVVERPASVVKELVENALDAGTKSISVTIEEAGRRLIQVADDGSGIPADELALAVSRHATSKLASSKELFSISTLGFRGEALASIGSVSRLTITSRTADSEIGARIRVEGGQEGKVEQIGEPVGTVVQVENLFYNVPARLKFLKSNTTERRNIDTFVTRYALAYPNVRFKLVEGKKVILQTSGDGDHRAILATLYGVETAKQMLEVIAEDEGLKLSGYISPTSITRSNRREMTFFINGRWVQDIPLNAALTQAYHTMLMVGRYPLATLFLEIDPEAVDVNVHPAKAEVRFRAQDKVFSFVQRAVRRALLAYAPVPSLPPRSLWGSRPSGESTEAGQVGLDWTMAEDAKQAVETGTDSERESEAGQPTFANIPLLRLIGQIGATYLVAEGPDGLYLVDQHAAHERVLFEKLMLQYDKREIPSQALLEAESVTLPPAQATLLDDQLDLLNRFGFQVEPFGPNTFQVRAMPTLFSGSDAAAALRALVEDFEEDESPLQEELEARIAARVCKRMAVKAGQALSEDEQRALLTNLENCDSPRTCPHGRPTMIHLSVDMLERQFGRKGTR
ncbi:MAG: DNA mismatch repair endonuclease MutL [Anaerolineales bacterium]|jgi:DNA mismatch repair protein MutL